MLVLRESLTACWPQYMTMLRCKLSSELCWSNPSPEQRVVGLLAEPVTVCLVVCAGPEDTPYSGGCFEFDIYFPPNYPQVPMNVQIRTTGLPLPALSTCGQRHALFLVMRKSMIAWPSSMCQSCKHGFRVAGSTWHAHDVLLVMDAGGGSVRFNPNLYNCGKVCLSLLGTWSGAKGETWDPSSSSTLQVPPPHIPCHRHALQPNQHLTLIPGCVQAPGPSGLGG